MKVKINGKSVIVKGKTVKDALNSAKINPETVLVKRKGRLIAQDETLKDNDVLELIAVISGG
ncbi:MAG TPA: MoaD/ThiS family protein [Candidatus Aenigmarchaeota archaeon]|nr:MoaD/ThiS family protein [Candidatus Aenigmarchaeota archaeon]